MLTNDRFAVCVASAVLFAALALLGQATAVVDPAVSWAAGGTFAVLIGFFCYIWLQDLRRERARLIAAEQRRLAEFLEQKRREIERAAIQQRLAEQKAAWERREARFSHMHSSCTPSREAAITGNVKRAKRAKPQIKPAKPVESAPVEPKPEESGILIPDWPIPAPLKKEK